jgi:hypothetical protein
MKKHLKPLLGILFLTILLILPFLVFAQGTTTTPEETTSNKTLDMLTNVAVTSGAGYKTTDVPTVAGTIVKAALGLLGIIFIVLMIVAGFKWMSAGGDEKEVETAQAYIKRAIIGLAITLSSWAIWNLISNQLAK